MFVSDVMVVVASFVVVNKAVVEGPAGEMRKLVQSVYHQLSRLALNRK